MPRHIKNFELSAKLLAIAIQYMILTAISFALVFFEGKFIWSVYIAGAIASISGITGAIHFFLWKRRVNVHLDELTRIFLPGTIMKTNPTALVLNYDLSPNQLITVLSSSKNNSRLQESGVIVGTLCDGKFLKFTINNELSQQSIKQSFEIIEEKHG